MQNNTRKEHYMEAYSHKKHRYTLEEKLDEWNIKKNNTIGLTTTRTANAHFEMMKPTLRESQKPMMYVAAAMELAKVNIRPIEPPNSGPREREIM